MRMLRIGILDDEREYVENLSAYLGRFGKGRWMTAAFTDREIVRSYLKGKRLDLIASTSVEELKKLQEEYSGLTFLWLSDQREVKKKDISFQFVYRFQSAKVIGAAIENMVNQAQMSGYREKAMVAVYSPVGRCGKTTMALRVAENESYGRWLYIGMEDYSSFPLQQESTDMAEDTAAADNFIYYLKEHQAEKLLALMEKSAGKIASGWSVFDRRQINTEDMAWLKNVLRDSGYHGMVCDFGTGVLQSFDFFSLFDYILVPYLKEEKALIKKNNFQSLLKLYELEDEKIRFIDMENKQEVTEQMDEVFRGESR